MKNKKLWGGRFKKSLDPSAIELSYSLESDKRLVFYDIDVNKAHAKALNKARYLTDSEFSKLELELEKLSHDFKENPDKLYSNDEDIHSCIERLIIDRCGNLGKKMHTGKSRTIKLLQIHVCLLKMLFYE